MPKFHNLFSYEKHYDDGSYHDCTLLTQFNELPAGTKIDCINQTDHSLDLYKANGEVITVVLYDVSLKTAEFDREDNLVYLAGPWFHPGQQERLDKVKAMLEEKRFQVFSPKDEILFQPGVTTPRDILMANVGGIMRSAFVLVITDGKDVGTIFEAGFSHAADIPILYFWEESEVLTKQGAKFNVMLAATGATAMNWGDLASQLEHWRGAGYFSGSADLNLE